MKQFHQSSSNIEAEINASLGQISKKLFTDSMNYQTSFRFLKITGGAGRSLQSILDQSLEDTVEIGGSESISNELFHEDCRDKISYQGDHGSHPNLIYIQSKGFSESLTSLLLALQQITDTSDLLLSFWLLEGNPFYPVFWEFSYLIESKGDSYIFIGSSSD